MKAIAFFLLTIFIFFFTACKKDPPTLNEKLEGSWRVTNYGFFDEHNPEYIQNGIMFQNINENKGLILWSEHRTLDGTRDTVTGRYILDETAGMINITWQNVVSPYLMTEDATYSISLFSDTLKLMRPSAATLMFGVKAVKN